MPRSSPLQPWRTPPRPIPATTPRGLRPAGSTETMPAPRVVLGAATTSRVVALTFDLDMNGQMAAAARSGAVWVNKDALAYLQSHKVPAPLFIHGMVAGVA